MDLYIVWQDRENNVFIKMPFDSLRTEKKGEKCVGSRASYGMFSSNSLLLRTVELNFMNL